MSLTHLVPLLLSKSLREPSVEVIELTCSSDNAGVEGITVASDKTILGEGSSGIIKGKGLRLANGVSNVIIQ